MYKNEKQLQSACVVKFRELYPELKNSLWSVRNTTLSERDGMTQRGLGMLAGASDLQFFYKGRFVGIEVKLPGSLHNKDHVKRQLKFGIHIYDNGGEYYIIRSVEAFLAVINPSGTNRDILDVHAIHQLIEESKSKVKF